MAEKRANRFRTTVAAGGIASGATSLPVSDPAPTGLQGGEFRILVGTDSEIAAGTAELMLVTATGAAGASPWTVTRGIEGTNGARAHAAGVSVRHVLTNLSLGLAVLPRPVGDVGDALGAAQTITFAGPERVKRYGTLTANHVVTLSGYQKGDVLMLVLRQDATGGRGLSLNDGVVTEVLPIPTAAGADVLVEIHALSTTDVLAIVTPAQTTEPPLNTVAPALTGTAEVGQTLTCSQGTWYGQPTSFAYQWKRNGAVITGATAITYTLVSADSGQSVRCTVRATNAGGGTDADSNAVVVTLAPQFDEPFTNTDGTLLQNHAVVTTWTKHPSAGTADALITANRLRNNDTADFSTEDALYYGPVEASADGRVRMNVAVLSTDTVTLARMYGRMPTTSPVAGYSVGLDNGGDNVELRVGSGTLLGTYAMPALVAGQNHEIDLLMVGTSIKVIVNGTERISVTDSTHTAAGRTGVQIRNITGATSGLHIDRLRRYAS